MNFSLHVEHKMFKVQHSKGFEPYFVARTNDMIDYDFRFLERNYDKSNQVLIMNAIG